jgi:hypothetical protein
VQVDQNEDDRGDQIARDREKTEEVDDEASRSVVSPLVASVTPSKAR